MPNLTIEELRAIDFACMVLLQHFRMGCQKKEACAAEGDSGGVEWYAQSLETADAARVTLRALIAKDKSPSVDLLAALKEVAEGCESRLRKGKDSGDLNTLRLCRAAITKAEGRSE